MKCSILFYALSVIAIGASHLSANAGDGGTSDSSGDGQSVTPKDPAGRPKAPSRKKVDAGIENGLLTIKFREPEGHASVEIKDHSMGMSLSFEFESAAGFRYALPPTSSQYQVTVRTELNSIYEFNF